MPTRYQTELGKKDYEINRRLPVVIMLDISGSMKPKINNINKAFEETIKQLKGNSVTKDTVDLCMITFNHQVNVVNDFMPISKYTYSPFSEDDMSSLTSLGEAVLKARDHTDRYKDMMKKKNEVDGISNYYQPVYFLLTDGVPYLGEKPEQIKKADTDFNNACNSIKYMENMKKGTMLTIAIGSDQSNLGANIEKLSQLTNYKNRVIPFSMEFDIMNLVEFIVGTVLASMQDIDSVAREQQKINEAYLEKPMC